ncbi:MAG: helix-turn-helix domain-containing protein [Syntrophobacterales bacterium]|jgi:transposase|nr:helix-turn-helix domain-containing protein [Syntrophobacterales bacterium]
MIRIESAKREELLLIMRVQVGQLTASEAARQMGVSRKTFYQRAQRGLEGMVAALAPRPTGRPGEARDTEKEALLAKTAQLQREKLELQQLLRVRELLQEVRVEDVKGTKKKAGKAGSGCGGRRQNAG